MENDEQQDKWDKALLGQADSNSDDPVEKKARIVRQLVLWRTAQEEKNLVSPYQASQFHEKVNRLHRRRRLAKFSSLAVSVLCVCSVGAFLLFGPSQQSQLSEAEVPARNLVVENTILDTPYMLEIPSGSFTMGCENNWDDSVGSCHPSEKPPHDVTVQKFALSKYEITVEQFEKFVDETGHVTTAEAEGEMGCTVAGKDALWVPVKEYNWRNPGFEQNAHHPVVCVSWVDTQAYIKWISEKTGLQYRLPTEEEWEYAARARKITAFYWGTKGNRRFANYRATGGYDKWVNTSPVGQFSGNAFGLYDMSGNAWEWVENCWTENHESECADQNKKVRKGGSWFDSPRYIRPAYRSGDFKLARSYLYGFRVAHDLE